MQMKYKLDFFPLDSNISDSSKFYCGIYNIPKFLVPVSTNLPVR